MPHRVTLPSGLAGTVRGFKAKEASLLADAKTVKDGTGLEQVTAACWLATEDAGPYKLTPQGSPPWDEVLVGDRMVALVEIRIATYGSAYAFKTQCQGDSCGRLFDWALDLRKDVTLKPYPAATLEALAAGKTTLPLRLPDGRAAQVRLMRGVDERAVAALRKKYKQQKGEPPAVSFALHMRVTEVEGIDGNDKLAYFDDMDMGAVRDVLIALDAVDGGIDTDVEVRCGECGAYQTIQLPFGREFFMPPMKKPVS